MRNWLQQSWSERKTTSKEDLQSNGRGALAEYPEVACVDSARDRKGKERPHCLPAILSLNQFWICRSRAPLQCCSIIRYNDERSRSTNPLYLSQMKSCRESFNSVTCRVRKMILVERYVLSNLSMYLLCKITATKLLFQSNFSNPGNESTLAYKTVCLSSALHCKNY